MENEELLNLIAQAKEGNNHAFQMLFHNFKPLIHKMANKFYAPGTDREDFIQEATIAFWLAIKSYSEKEPFPFPSFVKMVLHKKLVTFIRISKRKKHSILNNAMSLEKELNEYDKKKAIMLEDIIPDYNSANPEDLVIEEEKYNTKKEMLNEYLKLLTDLEKKILKEYLMGKSYREIALSVGCHTKSVDNALARIKRKTRENKEEYLEIVL